MRRREIIIGTRGSELALWQATFVKLELQGIFPDLSFELKIVKTTGDEIVDVALAKIDDTGLFTRQIENELIAGTIDLAVHSLKDLQSEQPEGLTIGAVCRRELPNDALVSSEFSSISNLPIGAKVATGSLRRKSQLLHFRPDLEVVDIRGNVPTRIKKYDASDLEGIILAFAGLRRLTLEGRVSEIISPDLMLPAVGQGAVAIEVREADAEILEIVKRIDHSETRMCVDAERAFLRRLEGGCKVPIGALATLREDTIELQGMVGELDGSTVIRDTVLGPYRSPEAIGVNLAEKLIRKGAGRLLNKVRREIENSPVSTML